MTPTATAPDALISPLRGGDPAALAQRVLEERAAGRIPLVGDDRWSDEYWGAVIERVAAAGPQPGQAWATLTSGSTGAPRVVLRTAQSWAASFPTVGELLGVGTADVLALSSPPASSLSLFSLAHAAAAGFDLALPRAHALTVDDVREATLFHGTPNGLRALLDLDPGADGIAAPRLRAALIGGAFLDPTLRERAEARGIRVISYYGAAELSFVAFDDGTTNARTGRSGLRAFAEVELAIRDGELWVRSPFRASGYLTGDGPLRTDGEWSTVGDRAELSGGLLTLLGRADEAILSAGATIVPAEVERALRGIDGVADAVVFGLPNPGVGALVTAVVEAVPGSSLDRAGLRAAASAVLAPTHRPRRWFVLESLPRTASGKPARAELIRRVNAGEVLPV